MKKNYKTLRKYAFRNLLIQKGIDVEYLAAQSNVSTNIIMKACMGEPIDRHSKKAILRILSYYYEAEAIDQNLFVQDIYH